MNTNQYHERGISLSVTEPIKLFVDEDVKVFNLEDDITWHAEHKIEWINGMWWVKGDFGSWDGPSKDWISRHRSAIVDRCVTAERNKVVVQAGGNLGMYPKLLSHNFGHVFTFEPERKNFACLCKNVTESNVTKINAALGDTNALVSMNYVDNVNRGATSLNSGSPFDMIPTFKIDQLNLPILDLLWLDVEGFEGSVLAGATETIKRCSPYLIVVETVNQLVETILNENAYERIDVSVADKIYAKKV